jgi:DNA-binding NtrC family response regulator
VRIDRTPIPTAFRLVASAAPGIDGDVSAHRFRADLYRRLSAVRIDMPLRERAEDVPALAVRLAEDICTGADWRADVHAGGARAADRVDRPATSRNCTR